MPIARATYRWIATVAAPVCVLGVLWAMTGSAAAQEPAIPTPAVALEPAAPAPEAPPEAKVADPRSEPTAPVKDATPAVESAAEVTEPVVDATPPSVAPTTPVVDPEPPADPAEPVVESVAPVGDGSVPRVAPRVPSVEPTTPPVAPAAPLADEAVELLLAPVANQAEPLLRSPVQLLPHLTDLAPLLDDVGSTLGVPMPGYGGGVPPKSIVDQPPASLVVAGEHAGHSSGAGAPASIAAPGPPAHAAAWMSAVSPLAYVTRSEAGGRLDSPAQGKGPGSLPAGGPAGGGSGGIFFSPFSALLVLLALAAPFLLRRFEEAPAFLRPTLFVCALERPG